MRHLPQPLAIDVGTVGFLVDRHVAHRTARKLFIISSGQKIRVKHVQFTRPAGYFFKLFPNLLWQLLSPAPASRLFHS